MEAIIDNLSIEDLKALALKATTELHEIKQAKKQSVDRWRESNPDKKKEHNKKYYEMKKLQKQAEKFAESPENKEILT